MNHFNVFKHNDSIKTYENQAGMFRLLVEDEDMEIFESTINVGKSIICQPYESINSLNVLIIINGRLFHTNERTYIESGDRITFKDLKITHHLSVLEKTKLLMIRNSKHFIKQATATDTIYNLIHQIQEKDQYTEEHCNHTGNLAVQIATMMNLPESVISNVLYAGKIHDVGKLNIPADILNKPSKLTADEYDLIKKHPEYGYNITRKETGNDELSQVVLDHHERLDGSGYPNGLVGEDISIAARIMAVADSYDAMISMRPYKDPMTIPEAIDDLKRHSGTWYDKTVVSTLIEILSYTNKSLTNSLL